MGRTPTKTRHSHVSPDRYDSPSTHRPLGTARVSAAPDQVPLFAASGEFLNAFLCLSCRDDGWLRMVPHDGGATVYYKWKFCRGEWSGYYLMYRDTDFNPSEAICGLLKKIEKVDRGELRPVRDVAYTD